MSIRINESTCIGCGKCVEACPGNLIQLVNNKAKIGQVKDCWGCTACMKECPVAAIHYFLGADMGGTGAELTIKKDVNLYHWQIVLVNGLTKTITIDKSKANQY